ncbi:hypothetical protein CBS101457_000966 [Exobasidium rhododendri]|nr:hypothetical protein CBS101457_000966 [Exobasidium rhododendri]
MAKVHPSLGDPGDVVEYYPLKLHPSSEETKWSRGPFRVQVPFADIPTIFAHRQWRAGMILADLLYSRALPLSGLNVLELGAGTGLPSIAAHAFGNARCVVATDYDSPSLIGTLKGNVMANIQCPSPTIKVVGHTWAKAIDDMRDLVPNGTFDAILLADCIWDDLSHAALLKSITSLLRKDEQSRVYMVSGLHTGRSKIVSFLRRAYRQGLQLVPFPTLPSGDWPLLESSEKAVQERQCSAFASDDLLAQTSSRILELQIMTHDSEEAPALSSRAEENGTATRIWQAKTRRLSNVRRAFVLEEREEEKKENQGVHIRNQWITLISLAWQ